MPLPLTEEEFFATIKVWFPTLYDIKYIMRQIKPSLKGGLTDVATDLGVGGVRLASFFSRPTSHPFASLLSCDSDPSLYLSLWRMLS